VPRNDRYRRAMTVADTAASGLHPEAYSAAQRRVLAAALDLFAEHGVSGTSLQMMADEIGVTKAAVYHQFRTKEQIVLAVAEVEMARLDVAVTEAEAAGRGAEAREVLLSRVISMAVERRRWVNALSGDPVMIRLLGTHQPFLDLMDRLYSVLLGDEAGTTAVVQIAIVSAAIGGAVVHPLLAGLDDETLEAELLQITRRLFDLPT